MSEVTMGRYDGLLRFSFEWVPIGWFHQRSQGEIDFLIKGDLKDLKLIEGPFENNLILAVINDRPIGFLSVRKQKMMTS
jgi:hypothetical protein